VSLAARQTKDVLEQVGRDLDRRNEQAAKSQRELEAARNELASLTEGARKTLSAQAISEYREFADSFLDNEKSPLPVWNGDSDLARFALDLATAMATPKPHRFREMADGFLSTWSRREGSLEERERLEAKRRELLHEREKGHFLDRGAGRGPRRVDLHECLSSLFDNLEAWAAEAARAKLTVVEEQLRRVVPEDLDRVAKLVAPSARRTAEIEQELAAVDAQLAKLAPPPNPRLGRLQHSHGLKQFWEGIELAEERATLHEAVVKLETELHDHLRRSEALENVKRLLEGRRATTEFQELAGTVLNDLMWRIQLSSGLLPAKVQSDGSITFQGVSPAELSTGQRTQCAVASSIGVNLALSTQLGSSVLLLDDVSAAYDVSNIAREALLWRLVAYGHLVNGRFPRRQLFLSSHNESTTRRLVEFLQPPEGAKMKLIRFVGWTANEGPAVEIEDVMCTAKSAAVSRSMLFRELSIALKNLEGR
jgi:hypothetical protein